MKQYKMTLDELASKIELEAKSGDTRLLATARLVRELKLRIDAGEAGGGVKWTVWGTQKFGRGKTWLYDLDAIARAKDPKAAIKALHRKNADKQKRRNDRLIERNPERAAVVRLVRQIDIEHLRKVRKYICDLTGD